MRRRPVIMLVIPAMVIVAGCASQPTSPRSPAMLDETSWRAISVRGEAPIAAHDIKLEFARTGLIGSTGCNAFGGRLVSEEGRVTLKPGPLTQRACLDGDAAELEASFIEVLENAPTLELLEDTLRLRAPTGEVVYGRVQ